MIVTRMLAEEASARGTLALAGNLELQDHLFALSSLGQEERFLAVGSLDFILAPVLVYLDTCLVRHKQSASICALGVVDIHHQVDHLASKVEVFGDPYLHARNLSSDKTDLLLEWDSEVEVGVIDDGSDWADMHTLSVADLTFAPLVIEHVFAHRDDLCFKEVAQLAAEFSPTLCKVE